MRNLHAEGVHPTDEWFLDILRGLNINVCPDQDKITLYRFCMGEKLTPIPKPTRREVANTVSVPIDAVFTSDLDSFFEQMKHSLKNALHDEGIEMGSLQLIDIESSKDGESRFKVSYLAPESDFKLSKRKRKASVFNALLKRKKEIYTRIDDVLSR